MLGVEYCGLVLYGMVLYLHGISWNHQAKQVVSTAALKPNQTWLPESPNNDSITTHPEI